MLTNTDDGTRNFVIDPIALIVDYVANILARFGGNIDRLMDAADDDEEEEVSSIYRQPSWRFYTNLGQSGNYHTLSSVLPAQHAGFSSSRLLNKYHRIERPLFRSILWWVEPKPKGHDDI